MRNRWRVAFLSVTALAIVMELVASFDGNPDTDPWTDMIVAYVPGEVTALAIAGLSGWLVVHFGLRYWRKTKAKSAGARAVERVEQHLADIQRRTTTTRVRDDKPAEG